MSGPVGDAGAEVAATVSTGMRDVQDFPLPGVLFKDISPLLADPQAFGMAVRALADAARAAGGVDLVSGVEARGFVLAAALANELNCGLVLVRKAGKLPPPTVTREYQLEYGTAVLEVPLGVLDGRRVYVVDDVLATGGTLAAATQLLTEAGAEISGTGVLLEIGFLNGRAALSGLSGSSGPRVTALLRV
ncbi:adenine phosphoribosyltransferase [Jatrophihabitans sp. GAS493]|uniref:adenine phosphoribosyltransferase n=1 Tax=Jatrophihabitans sp. GAS493 TaxID=1907575 RepID=UPI000BB94E12|nr:adenine phosphoribosyltransferase [Jatrophihabitans sp. GAS493]SOD74262.1 adenine phosphoribosyltransferase [Jatrophihabitans sp. GAS493]